MTDTTPRVEQRHIDLANDYLNSAFRCTATLAERFAQFEADHLAQHRQPGQSGGEVERDAQVLSAAIDQNDAMRQELANIGNLVSDLARALGVDQANTDGTWPNLSWRVQRLIEHARASTPSTERERRLEKALREAGEMLDWAARKMKGGCAGSDIDAVMLAAARTVDARQALGEAK